MGLDGTIYIAYYSGTYGNYSGKLYVIYSDSNGIADSTWPMSNHDPMNSSRARKLSNHNPEILSFTADPEYGDVPLVVRQKIRMAQ